MCYLYRIYIHVTLRVEVIATGLKYLDWRFGHIDFKMQFRFVG